MNIKTAVLLILDGWGVSNNPQISAITKETTPNLTQLAANYPFGSLQASEAAIGLPWGEAGNSEVGHSTLGAGRILYHSLLRINNAIKDGTFFKNETLIKAFNRPNIHIIGLLGTGTVHSSFKHLLALLEMAKQQSNRNVYLHLFTDGKDSSPQGALGALENLLNEIKKIGIGQIASLMGRNFAMDRDNFWYKTEAAYINLAFGEGEIFEDPLEFLRTKYAQGFTDADIPPALRKNTLRIEDGDSVIFFNFREDSARQLTEAFVTPNFTELKRAPKKFSNLYFATMSQYDSNYPAEAIFKPHQIKNTLGDVISSHQLKQYRVAETQKYAHITYFFNGSKEFKLFGETREIVPSLPLDTIEQRPLMSADKIAYKILNALRKQEYSFIIANFANADMLGHTGNIQAAKQGIKETDSIIGEIAQEVLKQNQFLIITSDHGNAEEMINPLTGEKLTEHTNNPVPIHIIANNLKNKVIKSKKAVGLLIDVAPTILKQLDLPIPLEISGSNLLEGL